MSKRSKEATLTDSMRLIIEPVDVWLFRDGRPFAAGEDHWASSLFPPTPFTMQGVIRSKILLDSEADLADYVHNPTAYTVSQQIGGPGLGYGQLQLDGPYLARRENGTWVRYYPLPADLVREKDGGPYRCLEVASRILSANWPVQGLCPLDLPADLTDAEQASGWIHEEALAAYLEKGEPPHPNRVLPHRAFFQTEGRFNVKVKRAHHRPERQFLAEVGFVRTRPNVGLDVEVSGVVAWQPSKGFLGIGGEARAGYYQVLGTPARPFVTPAPLPARFKLYLATPAWLAQGWQPADWSQWFTGGSVRLIAAAVRRAQRIGGWDIATKQQKPMRAYVPAGSVYFFECDGEVIYKGKPVTDAPDEGQIGLGQAFIGVWQTKDA